MRQTILHMVATADRLRAARLISEADKPPENVVKCLHAEARLFPAIRQLMDSGAIGHSEALDGVDPSPSV